MGIGPLDCYKTCHPANQPRKGEAPEKDAIRKIQEHPISLCCFLTGLVVVRSLVVLS